MSVELMNLNPRKLMRNRFFTGARVQSTIASAIAIKC